VVSREIERLSNTGGIQLEKRPYRRSDLDDKFLVIGATDDETLNRQVHADAEQRNMLCNIADRPKACNFILPAIVRRGDLVIAVSTSGRSPAYAKHVRQSLEAQFGEEHETFLVLMGGVRKRLLKENHAPEAHKPLFERLIAGNLIGLIREGKTEEIDALLTEVLGPGYDFETLVENDTRGSG
jgi:precorrin-2 dehydrogenase/sirohydrochlorin ferrochelatase